eukprot:TRINITY_DN2593_c0_g1_i3.p1 TRINITY_DN2593_c0_g1~~TRINITY_DN2593_c0_g1_i3.p1  ORF type:complete len:657 (-),score=161.16 TRINITY_DN2593_c0_g1_i3:24-1739(-)
MKAGPNGYEPAKDFFFSFLQTFRQLHDAASPHHDPSDGMLTMPKSIYNRTVRYRLVEYDPLLDSCNMSMEDWCRIGSDIETNYKDFDGFVVLHGTDTMAYTASALSFMLHALGKSVILTGSQVPIGEQRNDGLDNLLGALILAGHFTIPEVTVYFRNKLFRGNRTSKVNSNAFEAFESPNIPPLAIVGIDIEVDWEAVFRDPEVTKFHVNVNMDMNVGLLRLFPGITEATVKAFLAPPIKGVVLQTYGAGNAPDRRTDILAALKAATDRGVLIINCTQCAQGFVIDSYATGRALLNAGVIPGSDITPEAALTKLCYLVGQKDLSIEEKRRMLRENLRGELRTATHQSRFSFEDGGFIMAIARALRTSSSQEVRYIKTALHPVLMCAAAAQGDVASLQELIESGKADVSSSDYDGRTPLHLAAADGRKEAVKYLLSKGSSVYVKDRFGNTPLSDAVRAGNMEEAKLIFAAGGELHMAPRQVAFMLCCAVADNDTALLSVVAECGADINAPDYNGSTALHMAVERGMQEIVLFLLKKGANPDQKNKAGRTPRSLAFESDNKEISKIFSAIPMA